MLHKPFSTTLIGPLNVATKSSLVDPARQGEAQVRNSGLSVPVIVAEPLIEDNVHDREFFQNGQTYLALTNGIQPARESVTGLLALQRQKGH